MKRRTLLAHAVFGSILVIAAPEQAYAVSGLADLALGQVQGYLWQLLHPSPELRWVYGLLGAGCIVFGPAVYRFVVSLPGGLLLGAVGAGLGAVIGGQFLAIIGGLLGFVVGLSIAWALYQIGIFILGAWYGWVVLAGAWMGLFGTRPGAIVAILAFLCGLLAVALSNLFIAVVSAFVGGLLLSIAAGSPGNPWVLLGLTAIGVGVQAAMGGAGKQSKQSGDDANIGNALAAGIAGLIAALAAIISGLKRIIANGSRGAERSVELDGARVAPPVSSSAQPDLPYSGFWRRFLALAIDGTFMTVLGFLVALVAVAAAGTGTRRPAELMFDSRVTPWYVVLAGFAAFHIYRAVMESSYRQATLGKMATGIVAAGLDGGRLSFGRALARTVLSSVSSIVLLLGYLPHFFSRRKQAAHDMAAGALVLTGTREQQRDPKDTLVFPLGITAAMLALLCGARMLQFSELRAPYRATRIVEAPRLPSAPEWVSAPPPSATAPQSAMIAEQASAAAVPPPGIVEQPNGAVGQSPVVVDQPSPAAPTPAASEMQIPIDQQGRYGDIWRMIRASVQRNEDDLRRLQADIDSRSKAEHTNRREARKLNKLGLEAYRAQQIDEAVAKFSEAHRADPRDQEVCGNLGLALLDAGRLSEAESALMEALLIEPARVGAWTVLGMVIAERGDQTGALGALLNAHRYSKDQAKTVAYFTQLAETDMRAAVRRAASEAVLQVGQ